jgi:hypothetical protein
VKKSNVDQLLMSAANENQTKEVPAFFSKGLDEVLNQLPEQLPDAVHGTRKVKSSKKRNWFYSVAAVGVLTTGIIGSGFASAPVAAALAKIPGLHFIFSADYQDLTKIEESPNVQYGSSFQYGDKNSGPYNLSIVKTEMFSGYTDELKEFIGLDYPKLPLGEVGFIRVDKYGEQQFEMTASVTLNNDPYVLSVVPNAINLPQFDGYSVNPVIKSHADINGVEADVLSYEFSESDKANVTNYVTWQRDGFTMVLASTAPVEQLIDVSNQVDLSMTE